MQYPQPTPNGTPPPRKQRSRAFYQTIGKLGGKSTSARHGKKHYSAIGKVGGGVTYRKCGTEHYQTIGRIGAHLRWDKKDRNIEVEVMDDLARDEGGEHVQA